MLPNQVPLDQRLPILKAVHLFVQTPEDALEEAASLLEEIHLAEGEMVFQKGDPGESMYIIAA